MQSLIVDALLGMSSVIFAVTVVVSVKTIVDTRNQYYADYISRKRSKRKGASIS